MPFYKSNLIYVDVKTCKVACWIWERLFTMPQHTKRVNAQQNPTTFGIQGLLGQCELALTLKQDSQQSYCAKSINGD